MLREELDRIDSVPMLPELATRILKMVDDPQVTSHRLAAVVSRDQSLVTSILRIVNSAYYGFHWRISSVSQAVVLLGFRTIRNLVLAASVMKDYGGRSRVAGFDRMAHWRHSIGCGSAAALLAKHLRRDRQRHRGIGRSDGAPEYLTHRHLLFFFERGGLPFHRLLRLLDQQRFPRNWVANAASQVHWFWGGGGQGRLSAPDQPRRVASATP